MCTRSTALTVTCGMSKPTDFDNCCYCYHNTAPTAPTTLLNVEKLCRSLPQRVFISKIWFSVQKRPIFASFDSVQCHLCLYRFTRWHFLVKFWPKFQYIGSKSNQRLPETKIFIFSVKFDPGNIKLDPHIPAVQKRLSRPRLTLLYICVKFV